MYMRTPVPTRDQGGTNERDEGFTLIELLVVLLVIGILLAIAIPTFLSVTQSANDTAAQANLQTTLTGAKTYFTQKSQTYTGVLSGLGSLNAGVSGVTSSSSSGNPHVVSVDAVTGSALVLAAYAPGSHNCWAIVDITNPQSTAVDGRTSTGTLYAEAPNLSQGSCTAAHFAGQSKVGVSSTSGFSAMS